MATRKQKRLQNKGAEYEIKSLDWSSSKKYKNSCFKHTLSNWFDTVCNLMLSMYDCAVGWKFKFKCGGEVCWVYLCKNKCLHFPLY